jgi:cathepsin L
MRLLIVALLVAVATARLAPLSEVEYQRQFVTFAKDFSKTYTQESFFTKFNTFKYWVDRVRNHNAGNESWEMGINEYSDLMPEEFNAIYLSPVDLSLSAPADVVEAEFNDANDIDWRSKGAVTPVKNQGQCGSCWAFSTTGVLEGYMKAKGGSLPNLSEQQLVDCAGSSGNHGCNGGWPSSALKWIAGNKGSCSESSYPYTGRDGSCKKGCSPVSGSAIGGARTGTGESTLGSQLNSMPVSIALDASGGFQSYKSGTFNGPCGTQLNHAVLAVGYTSAYWMVKNSWGGGWGSGGYIYMARGKNLCGMTNAMAWPQ